MFKVCPKRCCHRADSHRQSALALPLAGQAPVTIDARSSLAVGRSRQLSLTIVVPPHPATVKTDSPALNAAPGKQGRAVKLEGGVA